MNPFLITLTFLTLTGIITSSEMMLYKHTAIEKQLFDGYLAANQIKEEIQQTSLFEDFKQEKSEDPKEREKSEHPPIPIPGKRKTSPLNFSFSRPPNNSRLNFYLVLHENDPFLYETAAKLMRRLYSNYPFFHEVANAEYQILDLLRERKGQTISFVYPEELSSISLGSEALQMIFYTMLKGEEVPSLLYFITFDKELTLYQKKINFMFASPELLSAVFADERTAEKTIALQKKFWEEILAQEELEDEQRKNRTEIKRQLILAFESLITESHLDSERYKKIFDFSLGKPGTILFAKDPHTGIAIREKYLPKKHRRHPQAV